MEHKGVFSTVTVFTGVVLLSFLAHGVSCRSRGSTNNSSDISVNSYRKGHHNQPQRYDLPHHHHNNGHRLRKHHQPQNRDEPEVGNESNKISLLRSPYQQRQLRQQHHRRQASLAPATSTTAASIVADTKLTRPSRHRSGYTSAHSRRLQDEDYDEDEDDDYDEDDDGGASEGRHAYLMTTDKKKSSKEKVTEDEALSRAFERHMGTSSNSRQEVHDVYAYQLPSDLWFVVRYNKRLDGHVDKYMNIVDSFTNYLDKLDKDVKSVSVNVKGVETVFRLTTKHNNNS